MQDVTIDRNLYIGGSDIPIILGISKFKKRFDLLQEKAGLQENDFQGNKYTEYGNELEPKIREFINKDNKYPFYEDKLIVGDIRCHVDGFNGKDTILEIKTTSQIHNSLDEYKVYLVQLLFYMNNYNVKKGMLVVYERPEDFNTEFDENRIHTYEVNIRDYKELIEEINQAVEQFRMDLLKVKENPFLTEEDLQPKELIELSNKVAIFEKQIAEYKKIEAEYKAFKEKLYQAMEEYKVVKWTTNGNFQITKVAKKDDVTVTESVFNVDKFKEEHPEIYQQYLEEKETIKKGKVGYVLITPPKN